MKYGVARDTEFPSAPEEAAAYTHLGNRRISRLKGRGFIAAIQMRVTSSEDRHIPHN
jgi:hypothetical protein